MKKEHECSVTILQKGTLIEMYEFGTGRRLVGKPRLFSMLLPANVRRELEETPAEKEFLELTEGFVLPGEEATMIMALATIPREMWAKEIRDELKLDGWYPASFSQGMCYFHDKPEESLGKIIHFGTRLITDRCEEKIAVTVKKRVSKLVSPCMLFKEGTQVVVIKEKPLASKKK